MRQTQGSRVRRFAVRIGVGLTANSLVCLGATQLVTAAPKYTAIDVQATAAISETPTTIGVADSAMYFYTQTQIDRTLDALQSLGVQNVRIQLPWAGVQLFGPDAYDWRAVDMAVDAAQKRNMGVLAVLSATPWWAGQPYLSGQPDSPEAYAKFVGTVADRYKGRISAYEIWNEPNARIFLDPVDPAAYTELLKVAYPAIKNADPSAIVVAGAVAAILNAGEATMNPVDFVQGMYAAGAHGYFDALSFHPYQYTLKFSDGESQPGSPLRQLEQIRQLMIDNGDRDLKVWASEYGLPTSVVSEQDQADFIEDFLDSWRRVNGTGPIFIYTTRDINSSSTADADTFGIFFDNGQLKEAARVIAHFLGVDPTDPDPEHPIISGIAALARELVRITGDVIQFGVDVGKAIVRAVVQTVEFLAKATVAVIRGVVDLTVNLVKAGADLVRDVVNRIVTAITDRGSPPGVAVAAFSAESAPVALRAVQPSDAPTVPAAQRVSAAADPVAGDPAAAATATGASPMSKADGQGPVAEPATVVDPAETPKPTEIAEPAQTVELTTTAKPTTTAEPTTTTEPNPKATPTKPSEEATPSVPDATLSEPAKTATKLAQAADKDESGAAPQGKPAATGGENSATGGAENGGSTG
jgi:hypothetical protein